MIIFHIHTIHEFCEVFIIFTDKKRFQKFKFEIGFLKIFKAIGASKFVYVEHSGATSICWTNLGERLQNWHFLNKNVNIVFVLFEIVSHYIHFSQYQFSNFKNHYDVFVLDGKWLYQCTSANQSRAFFRKLAKVCLIKRIFDDYTKTDACKINLQMQVPLPADSM